MAEVFLFIDPETDKVLGVLDDAETAIVAVLMAAAQRTNTDPTDWRIDSVSTDGDITAKCGIMEVQAKIERWEVDTL